jgi:predicted DNA-binding transcriptional regulator YafY
MNARICNAIRDRKVIRFSYSGGFRNVEPFCHGISTVGNDVLRCWQIGGYSESGKPQGWKLFRMDAISNLTITDEAFEGRRPRYNPNDSAMTTIYCHV